MLKTIRFGRVQPMKSVDIILSHTNCTEPMGLSFVYIEMVPSCLFSHCSAMSGKKFETLTSKNAVE